MRYPITLFCASLALPAFAVPAAAEVPRVVADTPVVHGLVAQVMGDLGTPDLLLDRGADPHNFQLRPSQASALSDADVVFWVGAELTPWLERALDGMGVEDRAVSLLAVEGLRLIAFDDDHEGHERDDHSDDADHDHSHDTHDDTHDHGHEDRGHEDHGHEDHGHEGHHGHDAHGDDDHGDDHAHEAHDHAGDHSDGHDDHGHDDHADDGIDPHAWLNTGNAKLWLEQIVATLAAQNPDNAATYRQNADAAIARIDDLTLSVQATLAPVADAPIMMFHDAYSYFADQFGLTIAGTITLGDAAAPGAARLAEMRAQLAQQGVVCVFAEVNHSSRYIDVVVEGSDVRVGDILDPAGVAYDGPAADLYATVLTDLADQIAACAGHDH